MSRCSEGDVWGVWCCECSRPTNMCEGHVSREKAAKVLERLADTTISTYEFSFEY